MDIIDSSNGVEKVFEVVFLAESCQLRNVIEANVDDSLDPRLTEFLEEAFRPLIREADREYFHQAVCTARNGISDEVSRKRYGSPGFRMLVRYSHVRRAAYRGECSA